MRQCSYFTFCPELIMIFGSLKAEDLRRGYVCKASNEARIAYLSRMIIASDRVGRLLGAKNYKRLAEPGRNFASFK